MGVLWINLSIWPNNKCGKKTNNNVGNDLLWTLNIYYIIKRIQCGHGFVLQGKGQHTLYILCHCDVGHSYGSIFLVITTNEHWGCYQSIISLEFNGSSEHEI